MRDEFNPSPPRDVSVFETTIRVLGGLLSAYALSGDKVDHTNTCIYIYMCVHIYISIYIYIEICKYIDM